MEMVVRMDGALARIVDGLIDMGYFKTKAEVFRAGVLMLGKEYGGVKTHDEIIDELAVKKMMKIDAEIKAGKRRTVTLDEVLKEAGIKRSDLK
ncbi:MAG: hypothetical protein ABIG96_06930 [Candidatus Micrarchaeota archaeon]